MSVLLLSTEWISLIANETKVLKIPKNRNLLPQAPNLKNFPCGVPTKSRDLTLGYQVMNLVIIASEENILYKIGKMR